jgi:iron uptake system component EfeO
MLKVSTTFATAVLVMGTLTACSPIEADVRVSVTQDSTTCELSQTKFTAGVATFVIQNIGETTAEFYILNGEDDGILTEVENIGAGLTRELTVELAEGTYRYSCEQMAGGEAIRGELSVAASTAAETSDPTTAKAIADYTAFVRGQAKSLLNQTREFVAAVKANDAELAKSLYASTRVFWERIEPVAESFGDLDPKMDAREGDLDPGVAWTGWHNLEKQLWVTGLQSDAAELADLLLADTQDLVSRIDQIELTISQMGNGAKELLDEVATGKVTGEEERYSHTDLWDFEANVFGAQKVLEVSTELLAAKDAQLLADLESRFAALNTELDKHRVGDGFKLYTELTAAEVSDLATLVEAVSEPLSKMTAALVK